MKISIPNIYILFWFLLMLSCSYTLTYLSFKNNLFTSDFILIGKFIMAFVVLISIAVTTCFIIKFRILIIRSSVLIVVYPFLFKRVVIQRDNDLRLNYSNYTSGRDVTFRLLKLKNNNQKMSFSDREFENFDYLLNGLLDNPTLKRQRDLIQARANMSSIKFEFYLSAGFFILMLWIYFYNSGRSYFVLIGLAINFILFYASLKRKMRYSKLIKSNMKNRKKK